MQPALHILVEADTLEEAQKLMIEEGINNDLSCGCLGYSWELLTWNPSYDQGPQYIHTKYYEASKDIKLSNRLQYRDWENGKITDWKGDEITFIYMLKHDPLREGSWS